MSSCYLVSCHTKVAHQPTTLLKEHRQQFRCLQLCSLEQLFFYILWITWSLFVSLPGGSTLNPTALIVSITIILVNSADSSAASGPEGQHEQSSQSDTIPTTHTRRPCTD